MQVVYSIYRLIQQTNKYHPLKMADRGGPPPLATLLYIYPTKNRLNNAANPKSEINNVQNTGHGNLSNTNYYILVNKYFYQSTLY